uniref:Uncharacterized protein n=1 Tax=Aegilops tauschii subsp. strangulata TaxID=200361 RepID=A0A453CNJ9_AEGTS
SSKQFKRKEIREGIVRSLPSKTQAQDLPENSRIHYLNGTAVPAIHLKSDGLASEGLHEDLHATTQTQDKVEGGLLLDVVVSEGATILQLLASKDEALLVRRNALLVLDLGLDVVDGVRALNLKSNGLAGEGLHKDLH